MCYVKRIVECGVGRLRVRKEGVWVAYCVNKGKGEEKGGEERSEADGGLCSSFAGR